MNHGELHDAITSLTSRPFCNAGNFESLVHEVLNYQYARNGVYRKYCDFSDKRGKNSGIHYLPVDIFKYGYVACFPQEDTVTVFKTAGTSLRKSGSHYFTKESLELKNRCFEGLAKELLVPDRKMFRVVVLCVPASLRNSKFLHNAQYFIDKFGTKDSGYFVNENGEFENDRLINFLRSAAYGDIPVFIFINIDYAYKFVVDCLKKGIILPLSKLSRILLSGFKEEKVAKQEFYYLLQKVFDLHEYFLIDDYGMTESTSSWYDNVLRNKLNGKNEQRCKIDPCWCRTEIVDASTLEKVEDGKVGLIRYINLANFNTCSFILTNDLGYKIGEGFEVIGKASREEADGYYDLLERLLTTMSIL